MRQLAPVYCCGKAFLKSAALADQKVLNDLEREVLAGRAVCIPMWLGSLEQQRLAAASNAKIHLLHPREGLDEAAVSSRAQSDHRYHRSRALTSVGGVTRISHDDRHSSHIA